MQTVRAKFEVLLIWLPLAMSFASTVLAGGQVHRYTDIPVWLSPFDLFIGLHLIAGALICLFQPMRFGFMFYPDSTQIWRHTSKYLFALIFGSLIVYWAALRLYYDLL